MQPVEKLQLFNEKVERLRGSRLVASLRNEGFGVSVHFSEHGDSKLTRTGPDDDALQAAVLTLRFFIQDNEPCSIRNLALIYEDQRIPVEIRTDFVEYRRILNQYLDGQGRIAFADGPTTPGATFRAVVYGDLSHSSPEHRAHFSRLFKSGFISAIAYSEFMNVIVVILRLVFSLSYLNRKVIDGGHLA